MNNILNNEFFSLYTGANINGDDVVGFMAPSQLQSIQGYLDRPSVLEAMFNKYDMKSHETHLGMVNLMATVNNIQLPMMADLLKTNSVLTIKAGGSVTYDLPIPQDPQDCAKVMVDTSSDEENGAIYVGVPFKLILDRPFTAGDLLKPDPTAEYQVEVSRDVPVEPYGGGSYLHYVIYQGANNSRKTFPKPLLREGQPWFKIGHKNGEYGTQFSTIQMNNKLPGHMTVKWTPSSPTTIETAITRQAALMETNQAKLLSDYTIEAINDQLDGMGGFEARGMFLSAKTVINPKDGKRNVDLATAKIDSTLEYLAIAELHKMQAWTNIFATGYVDHGSEGVIKVNDGLWRQMRRGKIIEYARPGGITLADLAEASNYYFKNSNIPVDQRYIRFKGGAEAVMNGKNLINKHAVEYFSRLPVQLMGTDSLLNGTNQKIVTGELDNLKLNSNVNFGEVFLNGVGYVSFIEDPSFNWNMGSNSPKVSGFVAQGYGRNTYTLIVDTWNARSGNVNDKVRGAKIVDGGKEDNPIYLVQPDHPYMTWGRTQGRMHDGARFTNVQSSLKYMGSEFWAITESDILLLDTTRCVVIELKDTYIYE